jgi:dihydroflavonol-4-reductase
MNKEPSQHIRNVLVTGGTGFLGAYIIRELIRSGSRVRAIKRTSAVLPFYIEEEYLKQVEWVEGDVLDLGSLEDAMEGMDGLVHSAAVVSFHKKDRSRMYATNVEGTANVLNMALESGIRRFVHVSSVAALGRTEQGDLVSEDKKWTESRMNTHYAYTKYKGEMEAWRVMAEGLDGVIVNPSTILGFGNWDQTSCAIFKNAYNGFPWYTNGVNGFVGVEDAAKAVVALLHHSVNMERYILNTDNWSFRQLLTTIAEGLNKKPPYREATPFLSEMAWRMEKLKAVFTGNTPLLSRESAKVAQSKTYFNNSKLLQLLPDFHYKPLEQTILESCRRYLAYYSR